MGPAFAGDDAECVAALRHCNAKLSIPNDAVRDIRFALVPLALHPPALNPHLTKSRLNDAPRLCEMLRRNLKFSAAQRSLKRNQVELVWTLGE
jgi:hypothetical protein